MRSPPALVCRVLNTFLALSWQVLSTRVAAELSGLLTAQKLPKSVGFRPLRRVCQKLPQGFVNLRNTCLEVAVSTRLVAKSRAWELDRDSDESEEESENGSDAELAR